MSKIFKSFSAAVSISLVLLAFTVVVAKNSTETDERFYDSIDDSPVHSAFYVPLTDRLYQIISDEINYPVQVGVKSLYAIELPDSVHPFLQRYHDDGEIDSLPYDRIHTPEAIAITILDYEQTPIDTINNSGLTHYFSFVPGNNPNDPVEYSENTLIYQLRLSIMLSLIDIEQKETIDAAIIETVDYGHNKRDGIALLFKQFEEQAKVEVRRFFTLFSTLSATNAEQTTLMLGTNFGLQKGTIFDIFTPQILATDSSISHYQRSGVLRLENIYIDSSTALIQRKWDPIDTTSIAILANTQPLSFFASYSRQSVSDYTNISINAAFQPFSTLSWLVGGHYHHIRDSYDHLDHGFGLQTGARFVFAHNAKMTFAGQTDVFLDFFFRDDDYDIPVSAIVPGIVPSVYGTLMVAPHIDLVLGLGYRFALSTNSWMVNTDENSEYEKKEASWLNETGPRLKYSGFFFSCGFRFIAF